MAFSRICVFCHLVSHIPRPWGIQKGTPVVTEAWRCEEHLADLSHDQLPADTAVGGGPGLVVGTCVGVLGMVP